MCRDRFIEIGTAFIFNRIPRDIFGSINSLWNSFVIWNEWNIQQNGVAQLYHIRSRLTKLSNKASIRLSYAARNVQRVWRLSPHNNRVEGPKFILVHYPWPPSPAGVSPRAGPGPPWYHFKWYIWGQVRLFSLFAVNLSQCRSRYASSGTYVR